MANTPKPKNQTKPFNRNTAPKKPTPLAPYKRTEPRTGKPVSRSTAADKQASQKSTGKRPGGFDIKPVAPTGPNRLGPNYVQNMPKPKNSSTGRRRLTATEKTGGVASPDLGSGRAVRNPSRVTLTKKTPYTGRTAREQQARNMGNDLAVSRVKGSDRYVGSAVQKAAIAKRLGAGTNFPEQSKPIKRATSNRAKTSVPKMAARKRMSR